MSDPVNTPGVADHKATGSMDAEKGYTPVFNNTVRTIAYVAGLIAGGFGVAYNPLRMAGK